MTNPVPGRAVTYPYGVKNSSYAAGYHTGSDYACPTGTKVVAPVKSKIVFAGWGSGGWGSAYGYEVIGECRDDGVTVQWAANHLSAISVHTGMVVNQNQQIGLSGDTGNTTGPHVHFEERLYPFRYANRTRAPQLPSRPVDEATLWDHGTVYVLKLRHGTRNSDSVRRLQYRLKQHRRVPAKGLEITGNWDEHTEHALMYWQRSVFKGSHGPTDGRSMDNVQANRLFGKAYRVVEDRPTP